MVARTEGADGKHGGVERIDVAGNDGLQRKNELTGGRNRVDRLVRPSAVSSAPFDCNVHGVDGSRHGAANEGERARGRRRRTVHGIDFFHRINLEKARVHHVLGACKAFFAGLEDEKRRAGEVWVLAEPVRKGEEPRGVAVVTAQVRDVWDSALIGHARFFRNRECVDVGAKAECASRARSAYEDRRSARKAAAFGEAEPIEFFFNEGERLRTVEADFGHPMKRPAQVDEVLRRFAAEEGV